jgi:hypothetical protein
MNQSWAGESSPMIVEERSKQRDQRRSRRARWCAPEQREDNAMVSAGDSEMMGKMRYGGPMRTA